MPEQDPATPYTIGSLMRLRPGAHPDHKRAFALQFNQLLDMCGIAHGEAFYVVSAHLWEQLKSDRNEAVHELEREKGRLEEKRSAALDAEENFRQAHNALTEIVEDVRRGIFTVDEIPERLELLALPAAEDETLYQART
jgi:hypothetical protein